MDDARDILSGVLGPVSWTNFQSAGFAATKATLMTTWSSSGVGIGESLIVVLRSGFKSASLILILLWGVQYNVRGFEEKVGS